MTTTAPATAERTLEAAVAAAEPMPVRPPVA